MDLRILEVGGEVGDGGRRTGGGGRSEDGRENRGRGRRAEAEGLLCARHSRIGQCVEDRGVDDTAIVYPVAAANHGLAVARDVIGKAEPRAKVVLVLRHLGGLRHGRIDERAEWVRQHFALIPYAQREAEAGQDLPVIGGEERNIRRIELEADGAEGLAESVAVVAGKGGSSGSATLAE